MELTSLAWLLTWHRDEDDKLVLELLGAVVGDGEAADPGRWQLSVLSWISQGAAVTATYLVSALVHGMYLNLTAGRHVSCHLIQPRCGGDCSHTALGEALAGLESWCSSHGVGAAA